MRDVETLLDQETARLVEPASPEVATIDTELLTESLSQPSISSSAVTDNSSLHHLSNTVLDIVTELSTPDVLDDVWLESDLGAPVPDSESEDEADPQSLQSPRRK